MEGTAEYWPPEYTERAWVEEGAILADAPPLFSSDLFALGCLAYELFIGHPPPSDRQKLFAQNSQDRKQIRLELPKEDFSLIPEVILDDQDYSLASFFTTLCSVVVYLPWTKSSLSNRRRDPS